MHNTFDVPFRDITPGLKKTPSVQTQIEYIHDMRKVVEDKNNIVQVTENSVPMLMGIEENLIAMKHMKGRERKLPEIQFFYLEANDNFFQMIKYLGIIVEKELFQELKHKEKQIYMRWDTRIQEGQTCIAFLEPQINLAKSLRMRTPSLKVQITVLPFYGVDTSRSLIAHKMKSADLIDLLNVCESWEYILHSILTDEPNFDFVIVDEGLNKGKEVANG